ncbi:hypothetical protein GCM10022393_15420 [Aquimarina addita]|uniref:Uncharacterized protein n=1 Tax=Aquimarina addita TaxID=870485 RepID=A0ABP7XG41_9FLAO
MDETSYKFFNNLLNKLHLNNSCDIKINRNDQVYKNRNKKIENNVSLVSLVNPIAILGMGFILSNHDLF